MIVLKVHVFYPYAANIPLIKLGQFASVSCKLCDSKQLSKTPAGSYEQFIKFATLVHSAIQNSNYAIEKSIGGQPHYRSSEEFYFQIFNYLFMAKDTQSGHN